MALDSKLTQNINLRANGDQLLKPLEAFGKEINKTIKGLSQLSDAMTAGGSKSEDSLRKQVQMLQRLVGEASTLQNILTSSNNRKRDGLFSSLDEQAVGKKALSASKLTRELGQTKSAADALELRLAQLYKRFGDLANAGRTVGSRDMTKVYNTEEAVRQVRRLEQELQKLDSKQRSSGLPLSENAAGIRAQLEAAQQSLLQRVQNPTRVNWTTEIAKIGELTEQYRRLTTEELAAARAARELESKTRQQAQRIVGMTDEERFGSIRRAASGYAAPATPVNDANIAEQRAKLVTWTERLDQATAKSVTTAARLREAMESGAPAAAIQKLVGEYHALEAEQARSLAMQQQLTREIERSPAGKRAAQPGLFSQLKESLSPTNLMETAIGGAGMTIGYQLISDLQAGIKYVLDFENALKTLQAITNSTHGEMDSLGESIMTVARNSNFSSLEIAKAATTLAQAGYRSVEIGDALNATLTLAHGSGVSPTEAVQTLTATLGAFQLQATESSHVADVLVSALNRSKLTINQMQLALQYAGATAHEQGVSFEELAANVALLSNAGIRSGATIGTGMRGFMVDLMEPTEKFKKDLKDLNLTMADVDVAARGLAPVVKTLRDAGFGAAMAYDGLDKRSAAAYLALAGQIDGYDRMAESLAHVGAAEEAQAHTMDSLESQWQRFLNVVGELTYAISGPALSAFKLLLEGISPVIELVAKLIEDIGGGLTETFGAFGTLIGGTIMTVLVTLVTGPIGGLIAGFMTLAAALDHANRKWDELATVAGKSSEELKLQQERVRSVDEAIDSLINRQEALKGHSSALSTETLTLTTRFQGLNHELKVGANNYDQLLEAMLRYRRAQLREEASKARADLNNQEDLEREAGKRLDSSKGKLPDGYKQFPMMNIPAVASGVRALSLMPNDKPGSPLLSTQLRDAISDLREFKRTNKLVANDLIAVNDLIKQLETRMGDAGKYDEAHTRKTDDITAVQTYTIYAGEDATRITGEYTKLKGDLKAGERLNQKSAHSGDALVDKTLARVKSELASFNNQRAALVKKYGENDPHVYVIDQIIDQFSTLVADANHQSRKTLEEEKKDKPEHAFKGTSMNAEQVKAQLLKSPTFKGANIYSTGKRSYGEQAYLYDQYLHHGGALAAKPGDSHHGNGTAFDMTPMAGVDMDQVIAYLEGLGLEVVEAKNEFSRKTGRYHWHFAWKAKTSAYQKKISTEGKQLADEQARDLQGLMEDQARYATQTVEKSIQTVITEMKDGKLDPEKGQQHLQELAVKYKEAALHQFDVEHTKDKLSAAGKQRLAMARAGLSEKLDADVGKFFAEYAKAIGDWAGKLLKDAIDEAEKTLKEDERQAQRFTKSAQSDTAKLGNRTNRSNYGAGTAYIQDRKNEKAQTQTDVAEIAALSKYAVNIGSDIEQYDAAIEKLKKGTPEYIAAMAARREAQEKMNAALEKARDLQQQVNDRTARYADLPLKEKLQGAARAWLENSGAMDSWAKQAENAVGPVLDNLTSGMATFFTDIVTGTKSLKAALGDFLKSFATFVLQMIAKALALAAVKAILKAIGLDMPTSSYGGGPVKTGIKNSFTGGPVTAPGRYNGGEISNLYGGGNITRGFTTHDSALYNLAHGEYVVNNRSVKELGLDFMDTINKHGAKGLARMRGPAAFIGTRAHQETNVYVVKPEERVPLGPNDIRLVIAEDILQGGQTKQLIKQVVHGA